jgi:hypothetical protein
VTVTGKPAQFVEPGLTSEVIPSTSDHLAPRVVEGRRIDRFASIEVEATGPWTASLRATGNRALSRGNQGPIFLLLDWEANQVAINPATPFHWTFTARPRVK